MDRTIQTRPGMKRVLVDGRVFSTAAFDRGMGRYVMHLLELLLAGGSSVAVLLFRNCHLRPEDPLLGRVSIRFANYDPEEWIPDRTQRERQLHEFTSYLSALIEQESYDLYIDATPFVGPLRLDIFGCAVVAICYDLIPLKHPDYYLPHEPERRVYFNGLARLAKADQVVCISEATRDEAARYLGITSERLSVICPTLEDRYLSPPAGVGNPTSGGYLFAIMGHHKSKNPIGALNIYRELLKLNRFSIRLNAPKQDQLESLCGNLDIPNRIRITASITDEEKYSVQSGARLLAHLSLEEGFGIPLLEALFVGRKILALDTAINRELLKKAPAGRNSAVFLIPPYATEIDLGAFERFLDQPADPNFFAAIRDAYLQHWRISPAILTSALDSAVANYDAWGSRLQAKIFSSIPGTACGVADYSVAYARSVQGNVMFFFSEGDPENISSIPNVRAGSYLDFSRFSRSHFAHVRGLFNFAFSSALHPGIGLMRTASKPGDVVLIHERRYFDGLLAMQVATGRIDELLLDFARSESEEDRSHLARNFAFHPLFNTRNVVTTARAPIRSQWLRSLPVRAVSHLPPAVLKEMHNLAKAQPGSVINDLEALESDLAFVPLGIDDRRHPSVARAARRLRILRQVQQDDVVVGHCGLILNDLKRLWDVVSAFVTYAAHRRHEGMDQRRVFFFLVGKVIDLELFKGIRRAFADADLSDRLIYTNPSREGDFDAEITACDAVACFRVQTRGQLSHVFVRALSLGTPVLVNRRSGYAYDPRTTIEDEAVPLGVAEAIERLFDPLELGDMRRRARREYESNHRGDASLKSILSVETT